MLAAAVTPFTLLVLLLISCYGLGDGYRTTDGCGGQDSCETQCLQFSKCLHFLALSSCSSLLVLNQGSLPMRQTPNVAGWLHGAGGRSSNHWSILILHLSVVIFLCRPATTSA